VKDDIESLEIQKNLECRDTVWCEIKLENNDELMIGVIYRSPNATDQRNTDIINTIREIVNKSSSHVMIMGDFNYPGIDWSMKSTVSTVQEQEFLEVFMDCFLWQHVMEPTRHRTQQAANILDLYMTNEEGMIEHVSFSEPIGRSDHLCLEWNLCCYIDRKKTKTIKYSYHKGSYDNIRQSLSVEWESQLLNKGVEEQWKIIKNRIQSAVEEWVPHKVSSNNSRRTRKPQWMNDRVLSKIRRKKTAFETY
jgi:Endonuclease-reverse transcriptase